MPLSLLASRLDDQDGGKVETFSSTCFSGQPSDHGMDDELVVLLSDDEDIGHVARKRRPVSPDGRFEGSWHSSPETSSNISTARAESAEPDLSSRHVAKVATPPMTSSKESPNRARINSLVDEILSTIRSPNKRLSAGLDSSNRRSIGAPSDENDRSAKSSLSVQSIESNQCCQDREPRVTLSEAWSLLMGSDKAAELLANSGRRRAKNPVVFPAIQRQIFPPVAARLPDVPLPVNIHRYDVSAGFAGVRHEPHGIAELSSPPWYSMAPSNVMTAPLMATDQRQFGNTLEPSWEMPVGMPMAPGAIPYTYMPGAPMPGMVMVPPLSVPAPYATSLAPSPAGFPLAWWAPAVSCPSYAPNARSSRDADAIRNILAGRNLPRVPHFMDPGRMGFRAHAREANTDSPRNRNGRLGGLNPREDAAGTAAQQVLCSPVQRPAASSRNAEPRSRPPNLNAPRNGNSIYQQCLALIDAGRGRTPASRTRREVEVRTAIVPTRSGGRPASALPVAKKHSGRQAIATPAPVIDIALSDVADDP